MSTQDAKDAKDSRAHLLLVSDVLPTPHASKKQARAWQLLESASKTHRVTLACVCHGMFSLQQWRALQALSHRVSVEPATRGAIERALEQVIDIRDNRDQVFDTVLTTSASLGRLAKRIKCRMRVVDLFAMPIHHTPRRTAMPGSWRHALASMWQDRNHTQDQQRERRVAQAADAVLVNNLNQRHQLLHTAKNIVVYPLDQSDSTHQTESVDALSQLIQPMTSRPVRITTTVSAPVSLPVSVPASAPATNTRPTPVRRAA